jgi:NADH-quinone oxidoreductase subunit C
MSNEVVHNGQPLLEVTSASQGMFGASGSGDTSGFGGLATVVPVPAPSERPYGSYFDEMADELVAALPDFDSSWDKAIEKVVVDREELTLHVRPSELVAVAKALRDEPGLRFELCLGVSGVHYPEHKDRELHAVYHFRSITIIDEFALKFQCQIPIDTSHRSCRFTQLTTGTSERRTTSSE